jgi:nucleotide-binding universal stress UspA family protein
MERFMAATDGSEGANRAIDVAAELAKAVGGRLYILNVASDLSGEALHEVMRSPPA